MTSSGITPKGMPWVKRLEVNKTEKTSSDLMSEHRMSTK